METDLSKGVLEKIRKEGLKPRSKWHFMLKDYAVLFAFGLSILLGALAFSIMLHYWGVNDWDAYSRINDSLLAFALETMPYFWLVGFGLFLAVAYYNLKHTRTGYRLEFVKVVALNLALTFIIGCILYSLGAGKRFEDEFARKAPFYKDMRDRQNRDVWFRPERGVIIGKVIGIDGDGEMFELDDPREVVWTVDASDARIMRGFVIREGYMVKVFGVANAGNYFSAVEIRPLIPENGPGLPFFPNEGQDN